MAMTTDRHSRSVGYAQWGTPDLDVLDVDAQVDAIKDILSEIDFEIRRVWRGYPTDLKRAYRQQAVYTWLISNATESMALAVMMSWGWTEGMIETFIKTNHVCPNSQYAMRYILAGISASV